MRWMVWQNRCHCSIRYNSQHQDAPTTIWWGNEDNRNYAICLQFCRNLYKVVVMRLNNRAFRRHDATRAWISKIWKLVELLFFFTHSVIRLDTWPNRVILEINSQRSETEAAKQWIEINIKCRKLQLNRFGEKSKSIFFSNFSFCLLSAGCEVRDTRRIKNVFVKHPYLHCEASNLTAWCRTTHDHQKIW